MNGVRVALRPRVEGERPTRRVVTFPAIVGTTPMRLVTVGVGGELFYVAVVA